MLNCETESQSTGIYIGLQSGVLLKMKVGIRKTRVAKGLKVPCLFMITEVSIRCEKNRRLQVYGVYPRIPPIHHWAYIRRHLGLMHVHVHCGGEQKQRLDCG